MSTPTDNKGEIDGRPVTWYYQPAENDQDGRLSWAEGRVTCKYVAWKQASIDGNHCSARDILCGFLLLQLFLQHSATVSNNNQHQIPSGQLSSPTT
jgi:hypothetical protein